jgi:carbamate kinase
VTRPRDPRLLVVALGGRAVAMPGRARGAEDWTRALERGLPPLVDVVAAGFRLAVVQAGVHPGAESRPTGAGRAALPALPLGLRAAETQGAAGYSFQEAFANVCRARGVEAIVATVVTRVEVAPDDPTFERPTQTLGPAYSAAQARRLARERGWTFLGRATTRRRAVPSPRPRRILEADAVRRLVDAGVVPIVVGGGVPVIATAEGHRGVEALLSEDATAGLLATALAADRLVLLTGVDRVEVGHRTARAIAVEHLSIGEARALLKAREFPAASIGAKIEAAVEFVEAGGREGIITSLPGLRAALDGRGGTRVVP